MFAVVANGIQTICRTQRQLSSIIAVYPYPKFQKCATEEEAREWLRKNARSINSAIYDKYGNTSVWGFAQIEYFISQNNIYYNIDTRKLGVIRVRPASDVKVDARQELVKVKVCNVRLDDNLIESHVVAVRRILKILGEYADVDIIVPDISIYLAATKYTGKNYMVRGLQQDIQNRLGAVSFTVRE